MFQFSCRFVFFNFSPFKPGRNFRSIRYDTNITRILTLYQANAATLTPFNEEDKIRIKNLYECKGYNARQFITKSQDKSWTKNSINSIAGEVEKVQNSRHVKRQCDA